MGKILLSENHPRGFCSNLICLLGALRKYPNSEIVLCPPFMALYAEDYSMGFFQYFQSKGRIRVANRSEYESQRDKIIDFGLVFPFASHEENIASNGELQNQIIFELSSIFSKEIEFNIKTKSAILCKLHSHRSTTNSWTIAIHRRASDHAMHTKILAQDEFINNTRNHLKEHKDIFIATDEIGFVELFKQKLPNLNIYSNQVERTSGSTGIHFCI